MIASPSIAILIPCYNQGAYLATAVESALGQTRAPAEIVIVNDGSTDTTAEVIAHYEARAPGVVRGTAQANRGLSCARQAGLEAARGEWLVLLDADDALEPEMCARCAAALDAHPEAAGAVGTARLMDATLTREIGRLAPRWPVGWPEALDYNPFGACHAVMVRRAAVEAVGGFAIPGARACEDWDLWARMIRCAMRFEPVPAVVARYRRHPATLSRDLAAMLDEKGKLLARFAGVDARLADPALAPAPPISPPLHAALRNGEALHALAMALLTPGADDPADRELFETLAGHLTPGGFDPERGLARFVHGLHEASSGARPSIAPRRIAGLRATLARHANRIGEAAPFDALWPRLERETHAFTRPPTPLRRAAAWLRKRR